MRHRHGQINRLLGEQERARPLLQLVSNHYILIAIAHHFHHAAFERFDFFAQHLGLPLLQTHRTLAVLRIELNRRERLGMALKEFWIGAQIRGDIVFSDRRHIVVGGLAHGISS